MTNDTRKPARTIELSVEVDAPVEAVWKALTDGEELTRWFPLDARVVPGTGGSVWMSWGAPWEGEARIDVWEPDKHLRIVEPPPQPGSIPVVLDYFLESRGNRTVLRLVHSFGTGSDWEEEYYDSTSRGWLFMFANLKHYLERHRGSPRQVAWPRWRVAGSAEEIWARLVGLDGFGFPAKLNGTDGGYSVATAGGERLRGVVRFHQPPRSLCVTAANLNDALLLLHLEKGQQGYEIWIWLSAYGLPPTEVEAFRNRWQQQLQQLFPEGTQP